MDSENSILENIAVARRVAEDAGEIFNAYTATPGLEMALTYTAAPEGPANTPSAPGPGGSRGSTGNNMRGLEVVQPSDPGFVSEHEIFVNERDAIAFFFYHNKFLDNSEEEGPFWFIIEEADDGSTARIVAGTGDAYAIFDGISNDIVETARRRGVIMLVEFENQEPYRCTPCYLSDDF